MNFGDNLRSENKMNGSNSGLNRKQVSKRIFEIFASELSDKKRAEAKAERDRVFGTDTQSIAEKREEGIHDRINAIPYNNSKYDHGFDQKNYEEGFFTMGNRALLGRIEKLSDEELQKIGANDYTSGVVLETLSPKVKNNSSYTQGYLMASIMSESKGKSRR